MLTAWTDQEIGLNENTKTSEPVWEAAWRVELTILQSLICIQEALSILLQKGVDYLQPNIYLQLKGKSSNPYVACHHGNHLSATMVASILRTHIGPMTTIFLFLFNQVYLGNLTWERFYYKTCPLSVLCFLVNDLGNQPFHLLWLKWHSISFCKCSMIDVTDDSRI